MFRPCMSMNIWKMKVAYISKTCRGEIYALLQIFLNKMLHLDLTWNPNSEYTAA